ncbi:MAG: prenyltransferase/squalene oxidase repeat-containing protein, partial [Candidatus Helarchaeota archaeon]
MDRETKKKVMILVIIFLLFGVPLIALGVLNLPPSRYISVEDVSNMHSRMGLYTEDYQTNHTISQAGLFIECSIDSLFREINTTNALVNLAIQPDNFDTKKFQLYYLWNHQNSDGGFSDVAGAGNLADTYKALYAIDLLNSSALTDSANLDKLIKVISFVNKSKNSNGGYGFRPPIQIEMEGLYSSDPIYFNSTIENIFYAIKIYKLLNQTNAINITTSSAYFTDTIDYINDCQLLGGGYKNQNETWLAQPNPSSSFFAVDTLYDLNRYPLLNASTYFDSLQNADGGFGETLTAESDIASTYYCTFGMYRNGTTPNNISGIQIFVNSSQNLDGGFGNVQGNASNFISAYHAMMTLNITGTSLDNAESQQLYNWLLDHRGMNGLFGGITLESIYAGVVGLIENNQRFNFLNVSNIIKFVVACQNMDGGFGSNPSYPSNVYSTYAAIEILSEFRMLSQISILNATNYLKNLQEVDGGFSYGGSLSDIIEEFFGSYYATIYGLLIDEDESNIPSTYWASAALVKLDDTPTDLNGLQSYVQTDQNADGGFGLTPGMISDTISTYYAVKIMDLLEIKADSPISIVEFLKSCEDPSGQFYINPLFITASD